MFKKPFEEEVSQQLFERCLTQEWSDLQVREKCLANMKSIGRGVIAMRAFEKGEILLDYHAQEISREFHNSLLNPVNDETDGRSTCVLVFADLS